MKTFDPTKPVQTRDGRKARILATDLKAERSICAAIAAASGHEVIYSFYPDGRYYGGSVADIDLINIPEKRVVDVWISVYDSGEYSAHLSEAAAARCNYSTSAKRIACIHKQIEIEVPSC